MKMNLRYHYINIHAQVHIKSKYKIDKESREMLTETENSEIEIVEEWDYMSMSWHFDL